MRYELADHEWAAIKPMLPDTPRGVPQANDRRALNGIFWVLQPEHHGAICRMRSRRAGAAVRSYQSRSTGVDIRNLL